MPLPATEDENIDQTDKIKVQAVCPYIIDGLLIKAKLKDNIVPVFQLFETLIFLVINVFLYVLWCQIHWWRNETVSDRCFRFRGRLGSCNHSPKLAFFLDPKTHTSLISSLITELSLNLVSEEGLWYKQYIILYRCSSCGPGIASSLSVVIVAWG